LETDVKVYPVNFVWKKVDVILADGEIVRAMAMVPAPRYASLAAKQFAEGEEYTLDQVEERSMASHRQFFAALKSGYDNLPENIFFRTRADGTYVLDETKNRIPKWPSVEHYRKWLLIETGWYDEREIEEANEAHAKRLAHWLRPEDTYARIFRRGCIVVIQRAKSMAVQNMKAGAFKQCKADVLALNDALTGVASGTHMREAGGAA
jgi:hypothetical protein